MTRLANGKVRIKNITNSRAYADNTITTHTTIAENANSTSTLLGFGRSQRRKVNATVPNTSRNRNQLPHQRPHDHLHHQGNPKAKESPNSQEMREQRKRKAALTGHQGATSAKREDTS